MEIIVGAGDFVGPSGVGPYILTGQPGAQLGRVAGDRAVVAVEVSTACVCLNFGGCTSLAFVKLPSTSRVLPRFEGCYGLVGVTLSELASLEQIGWRTFDGCRSLAAIAVPPSVRSIGIEAFA
jgi:hypothetical protein